MNFITKVNSVIVGIARAKPLAEASKGILNSNRVKRSNMI